MSLLQTPWTSIPVWISSLTAAWWAQMTFLLIKTCLARFARWVPPGIIAAEDLVVEELDLKPDLPSKIAS